MRLPSTPTWQIPPWIDMPRLEAVLGCALRDLDWRTLQRLIADQVPEDLSLDYKGAPYAGNDEGRFELGKDVAAFANALGGLIIIGIGDTAGVPSGFSHQSPTDAARRDVTSTLVRRLAPFVDDIEIGLVGSPDGDDGCVLILVPPSGQAPHAVTSTQASGKKLENGLWWPVREGSQTRWLREAELAARYRDRFTAATDADARVRTVFKEGVSGIDRTGRLWLAVGLASTRPAKGRSLSARVRDEIKTRLMSGAGYPRYQYATQPSYGRGRVVLSDRFNGARLSSDWHVELHMDGSGFAAVVLEGQLPHQVTNGRVQAPHSNAQGASSGEIAFWLICLLDVCARHAVLFGAGGEFQVTAQLLAPLAADEFGLEGTDVLPQERPHEPVVLTEFDDSGRESLVYESDPLTDTTAVSISTAASIGLAPRDLVAACAQLANEIYAEFGQLPRETLLHLSGSVSDEGSNSRRVFVARLGRGQWAAGVAP